ncbi:MAG: DUF1566 domain-containing protein [Gammaproteobacteria bacterium]|jgi:hypothetical protein|nr:DUF1566 domain-containing protein [Gammaproteobacteria bacterium]MBT4605592.1 DUF1566 domain-containing protein [Thiotrichales bacterium]MBT3472335.1 DUF1566 domain-containing protein [Gammaproteobacteria bacterium]MBT3967419.1 DUF1566 domain-containing protein [Gammaproteobacteria bacterium]MBT4081782.1 DUF1566 domain-containing protein [Gammaproteobacteria bacterium]
MIKKLAVTLILPLLLTGCDQLSEKDRVLREQNFVRVTADGSIYTGSGNFAEDPWACVYDKSTGLHWEVKNAQPGLRAAKNTYTWHDPDMRKAYIGVPNGGSCTGSDCDAISFLKEVNKEGICGLSEWHLPENIEMGSIAFISKNKEIDPIFRNFFPNTQSADYWTSSTYAFQGGSAWAWDFKLGFDHVDWQKNPKHIRLVHGKVGDDYIKKNKNGLFGEKPERRE